MFLKGAVRAEMQGRRTGLFVAKVAAIMAAVLSVPVMMYSFDPNPPIGNTGAPGQGQGCAQCHGTLTTPSALMITAPTSYTPGGGAVSMTVSIPSSGGFELVTLAQTGNAQAGTLTAGTGSQLKALGAIQDLSDSASNTSWTFSWTPPATNVGNVVVYATGGTHNVSYLSSVTITAPSTGPPPLPTLNLSSTRLTFTAAVGGTAPSQPVMVTTSTGSMAAFSAAATTTPTGGTWLSASPATGTTPASESISVSTTGLAAGTYNGTVTFTSSATSPTSVTLPVTLTVGSTTPPPTAVGFSLTVVDRQSGGSELMLLYGSGSVSSSGTVTGSGFFTSFRSLRTVGSTTSIVASGTWKAMSVTSSASGKLVLDVQLTTTTTGSSTLSTGTLTITTGSGSGAATLAVNGSTFNSVGIGRASITPSSTGGGGGGGGDDGGTGTGGTGTTPPPTDN